MEQRQLIRLCHNCNCLNESDSEILRCEGCGKGFLPLNYFEKIRARAQQSAPAREEMARILFNPINGLIVFW